MGKRKSKETTTIVEEESQPQSGIFTTLFSADVPKVDGDGDGFSSLFSDDNPFRRKPKPDPKLEETQQNPDSITPIDVDEAPKKSKKEKKLKSEGDVEMETNLEDGEENETRKKKKKKKKKRKRDEIENEYETKKYGNLVEEEEKKKKKKVGEKRKKADEVADTMVSSKEGFDDE